MAWATLVDWLSHADQDDQLPDAVDQAIAAAATAAAAPEVNVYRVMSNLSTAAAEVALQGLRGPQGMPSVRAGDPAVGRGLGRHVRT